MVINLTRNSLISKLKEFADQDKYVVLTGVDGTGKTYLLKDLYPYYYIFKFDGFIARYWLEYDIVRSLSYEYSIFDRHPIIDHPVYTAIREKNLGYDYLTKFVKDYSDEIKNFVFFVMLNNKYANLKTDDDWAAIHSEELKESYRFYIDKIKDITDVYLIED